jgi:hypothetical protein
MKTTTKVLNRKAHQNGTCQAEAARTVLGGICWYCYDRDRRSRKRKDQHKALRVKKTLDNVIPTTRN